MRMPWQKATLYFKNTCSRTMALTVAARGSTDDIAVAMKSTFSLSSEAASSESSVSMYLPCSTVKLAAATTYNVMKDKQQAVRLCRIPKFHSHRAMTKALG